MSDKCIYGHDDCFAYGYYGKCNACESTKFSTKGCPFYKTKETRCNEHLNSVKRLKELDRYELIVKFGYGDRQVRIWGEIVG